MALLIFYFILGPGSLH